MYPLLALLVAVVTFPFSLLAQDSAAAPPATPFRRGQWAAQFQAGSGFTSLGFLKFRSPARALVFDVRITGSHSEALDSDSAGTHFRALNSEAFTQLRLGVRRFHALDQRIVSHYTAGLLAGFDHDVARGPGFTTQRNGWSAGAFGDLGATYLVTQKFGLGALAGASLTYTTTYSSSQQTGSVKRKSRTWQMGGSAISGTLVATLFF